MSNSLKLWQVSTKVEIVEKLRRSALLAGVGDQMPSGDSAAIWLQRIDAPPMNFEVCEVHSEKALESTLGQILVESAKNKSEGGLILYSDRADHDQSDSTAVQSILNILAYSRLQIQVLVAVENQNGLFALEPQ